jgi:hypothetical protein
MQGSSSGIFPPFSDDRMSAKQSAETWGSKTRMSSRICTAFYDRRFPIKEEHRNIKFEKNKDFTFGYDSDTTPMLATTKGNKYETTCDLQMMGRL